MTGFRSAESEPVHKKTNWKTLFSTIAQSKSSVSSIRAYTIQYAPFPKTNYIPDPAQAAEKSPDSSFTRALCLDASSHGMLSPPCQNHGAGMFAGCRILSELAHTSHSNATKMEARPENTRHVRHTTAPCNHRAAAAPSRRNAPPCAPIHVAHACTRVPHATPAALLQTQAQPPGHHQRRPRRHP